MRTTLTIEPDVAAEIEQRRRDNGTSLKGEINELLRLGLGQARETQPKRGRYRVEPMDLGKCYFDNLDDIHDVLAQVEGEDYK